MSNEYDPVETCVNCTVVLPITAMYYDTKSEHYVCDRQCFDEWADRHGDVVADYYFDNIVE